MSDWVPFRRFRFWRQVKLRILWLHWLRVFWQFWWRWRSNSWKEEEDPWMRRSYLQRNGARWAGKETLLQARYQPREFKVDDGCSAVWYRTRRASSNCLPFLWSRLRTQVPSQREEEEGSPTWEEEIRDEELWKSPRREKRWLQASCC